MASRLLIIVSLVLYASSAEINAQNPACTTPNGIPGQCISAYLCREIMMFIVEKPIPVHRQQYLKQSACKRPDVKFPVCCQLKEIISAESLLPTECGVATSDRIAYGLAAAIFEFPWMALLRYREFNGDIVDGCGGSLINERYVLTAAHCLKVKTKTLDHVRLGELNKNTIIDCEVNDDECAGPVQDIKVERSIIHPQYNMPKFSNDIGLIRLRQSVVFQEHIKPICLPVTHKLQKTLYPRYILTGWGKTEKDELSDILQKAVLPRIDNEQCMQVLKQNQLRIALTDKQMCAGGEKRVDSCRGDSGGPLAWVDKLNDAPRFIQFGIVSLGSNTCGEKSVPSIYTRVGQYMDWILNNLHPS
ncbi:AAEL017003-PA [Aedes aegypti]|uniref:CLIP domain-containing serine protease n=3 Tax=Aedes aegypti TaxID=7159 RepID=J9E9D3_AEDAE|nr:AAEL017555-PA [Aedes aegypti]EJY57466.1 AAEL017003-PA [Aedes aegypti]